VSSRLFDYVCAAILQKHTVAEIPLSERLQWLFSSADSRLPSFVRDKHQMNVHEFHERYERIKIRVASYLGLKKRPVRQMSEKLYKMHLTRSTKTYQTGHCQTLVDEYVDLVRISLHLDRVQ
jgi:hypothetical protein